MAASGPDQAKTGATGAGATIGAPETQVIPRPGRYEIDTSCSAVTFRTRHLFGLAPVRGSFAIRAGTVDVAEPLAGSSVYVQIDPASTTGSTGKTSACCWPGAPQEPSSPSAASAGIQDPNNRRSIRR
jgi:hypothetical protein